MNIIKPLAFVSFNKILIEIERSEVRTSAFIFFQRHGLAALFCFNRTSMNNLSNDTNAIGLLFFVR